MREPWVPESYLCARSENYSVLTLPHKEVSGVPEDGEKGSQSFDLRIELALEYAVLRC